jgi:hypothetical protein
MYVGLSFGTGTSEILALLPWIVMAFILEGTDVAMFVRLRMLRCGTQWFERVSLAANA